MWHQKENSMHSNIKSLFLIKFEKMVGEFAIAAVIWWKLLIKIVNDDYEIIIKSKTLKFIMHKQIL